jgi:glucans biosynthesis protein
VGGRRQILLGFPILVVTYARNGHCRAQEDRMLSRPVTRPHPARLLILTLLLTATWLPARVAQAAFGLDDVAAKAQQLAQQPFHAAKDQVPEWMLKMSYDQWRDIRFRPDHALWRAEHLPFEVQFFHPGLYYDRTIAMNVVDTHGVHPVPFSTSSFDYGKNDFAGAIPQDIGYAGFRIHAPIKTPKYFDEVIVFLGASYFRALGKQEIFGASARGLAIDTAESSGEEFPYFTEFWLVQPTPSARSLTLYALLDSPSTTGAYRFVIQPGEQTTVNVDERLFPRKEIHKLGIAPLTSMFFFGENATHSFNNFRPEIHDSDGLMMVNGTGEWLWRPLDNPHTLQINSFQLHDPKGFGLMQRDRNFDHYQDLETRQELRPSIWIAPRGDWGEGRVELVEIPTQKDINDNIVAYWVPQTLPALGEPVSFSYTMYWYGDDPTRPPAGRVVATRREPGSGDGTYRFVIDFEGKQLKALRADAGLRGVVTVAGGDEAGTVLDQHVIKNPVTGGWRLSFQVKPKTDKPLELRAFLDRGGSALTETWTYGVVP